jgi:hypothetical protein
MASYVSLWSFHKSTPRAWIDRLGLATDLLRDYRSARIRVLRPSKQSRRIDRPDEGNHATCVAQDRSERTLPPGLVRP